MKNYKLLIAAIIFFAIVNTWMFWDGNLGTWSMLLFMSLVLLFLVLTGAVMWQLFSAALGYHVAKKQWFAVGFAVLVLLLTYLFPAGLLRYMIPGSDNGDTKLIASAEGAANCMTTFKLFENNRFMERNVCFSTNETWGNYHQKGDTLFFNNVKLGREVEQYYQFAVIKMDADMGNIKSNVLYRYNDANDTAPRMLYIRQNKLK